MIPRSSCVNHPQKWSHGSLTDRDRQEWILWSQRHGVPLHRLGILEPMIRERRDADEPKVSPDVARYLAQWFAR